MNSILKPIYAVLMLTLFFNSTGNAQNENARKIIRSQTNVEKLEKLSSKWEKRYEKEYRRAVKAARKNGWPIRKESEDGTIIEIYRLDEKGNPVYRTTENDDAATSTQTDQLHSGGSSGLNLEGKQMTIGEWDGGATRLTHEQLNGRATQADGATSLSNHATHVAGTLVGDGTPVSSAKGMAPQANLDAHDWGNDNSEMATAAANGLLISNHSYGTIAGWRVSSGSYSWWGDFSKSTSEDENFGQYNFSARSWDIIAENAPYYLIVKSAGNDRNDQPPPVGTSYTNGGSTYTYNPSTNPNRSPGPDGGINGYDCIATTGNAKNILTVGATNDVTNYSGASSVSMSSFSGWGPTDDGRIKPDICGNGVGLYSSTAGSNSSYSSFSGTSMSGPNVAGSMLLLQEHYMNLHGDTAMLAATLKGLVIHTAREAGSNPGPDYSYGWGLLSTRDAADVISEDSINPSVITERTLQNNSSLSFQFKALGSKPIRATICWTDPAGNSTNVHDNSSSRLVNDLDLRISDSSSTFQPYVLNPGSPAAAATNGDNTRDNVEHIYIANPVAGKTYTVTVNHKGTLANPQDYSLILTGQQLASCPAPLQLSATAITDTSATLSWQGSGSSYELIYGLAGFNRSFGGTKLNVNGTSTNISGLSASTSYDFYVREICTVGDTSFWRKATFATGCSALLPVSLPYLQNWEFTNGIAKDDTTLICSNTELWDFKTSLADGRIRWGGNAYSSLGNGAVTLDRDPNGSVNFNELILTLNLSNYSSNSNLELHFDYQEHSEESHPGDRVWIRGAASNNWVEVYNLYANATGSFQSVGPLDIDSLLGARGQTVGSGFQVRFGQEDNFPAPTDGFTFDNIMVRTTPTCLLPTALSASSITSSGASLNWTENNSATQWQISYTSSNVPPDLGNKVLANSRPFTLGGLGAGTTYNYYVRSICAAGDTSAWSVAGSFQTLCGNYLPAPNSYDFEGESLGVTGSNFKNCWTSSTTSLPRWEVNSGGTPSNSTGPAGNSTPGGSNYVYMETSSPASTGSTSDFRSKNYLIGSLFAPYLEFHYHMHGFDMGTLRLRVSDDGGTTWTTAWSKTGEQHTLSTDSWSRALIDLKSYGDSVQFKFEGTRGSGFRSDMALDDIAIFDSASCSAPDSLRVSFSSLADATLHWRDNSFSSQWILEYDTLGIPLGVNPDTLLNARNISLSGLKTNTTYRFRVRALCASGDTSDWSAVGRFTTPCAPTARSKTSARIYLDANGTASSFAGRVDSGSTQLTCRYDRSYTTPASFSCSDTGQVNGTLFVINDFGDTAQTNFTAVVIDTVAPVVSSIPNDTTLGFCQSSFTYSTPSASDNCSSATVTLLNGLASGSSFPVGNTVNSFRLKDASGNSRVAKFTVTVKQKPSPVLPGIKEYCLDDATVDLSFGQNISYAGPGIVGMSRFSPSAAGVGMHNLVYTLTGANGCTVSDTVNMRVWPLPSPSFTDIGNDSLRVNTSYSRYQWYRNGSAIAGANSRSYKYKQAGFYQVETETNKNCTGISDSLEIKEEDIGSREFPLTNAVQYYPNPGDKVLNLEWNNTVGAIPKQVRIYDATGRLVYSAVINSGGTRKRLDVGKLAPGLYEITITTGVQEISLGSWIKQ